MSLVLDLIDPRLLFEAADSITESFFLSPENVVWNQVWIGLSDSLPEMELFDPVPRTLNICG